MPRPGPLRPGPARSVQTPLQARGGGSPRAPGSGSIGLARRLPLDT